MGDRGASELIFVPVLVNGDEPLTMVVAETENNNRYGKVDSGAIPPVPSGAPDLRARYKLQEVLESDRILGQRYRRSIID